jgi:hypothetical protein
MQQRTLYLSPRIRISRDSKVYWRRAEAGDDDALFEVRPCCTDVSSRNKLCWHHTMDGVTSDCMGIRTREEIIRVAFTALMEKEIGLSRE